MSNIAQVNTYAKVKQSTDRDTRNFGPLVSGYEFQTSTLNQTQITLTQFVCDLSRKSSILLVVDGQILTEGSGNDYVWVTGQNGTSSQITLSAAIPAGLNIQVYKLGASNPTTPNADTIQAISNFALAQTDQKNVNRLINGGYDFWQRGTSFSAVANASYTADRWVYRKSGTMVHSVSRSTDLPTGSTSLFSMLVDCTTADTSILTNDHTTIDQLIEGNVLRTFKNKTMVLSFWVKSTKTGTFCVSFSNSAQDRSLVKEYTVSSSNTWERKTIRLQHDSTGTWVYDTGIGLRCRFVLTCGPDLRTTADTWQNGNFIATSNQVNATDSASNDFYLSDVVLTEDNGVNNKIPDFCLSGRDIFEELQLCQRYYNKSYELNTAPATATSVNEIVFWCATTASTRCYFNYPVPMRVAANLLFWSRTGVAGQWIDSAAAARSVDASAAMTHGFSLDVTPGALNRYVLGHYSADAEL